MRTKALFFIVIFLLTNYIVSINLLAQESNDPVENFEYLWKAFDLNYGIFGPKKIDWNALYQVYRPQVTPQTTEEELFNIMSNMLKHLNDNHVRLQSSNRIFLAGILWEMADKVQLDKIQTEDFSLELVKNNYLKGNFKTREKISRGNHFCYGKLSDTIGYLYFSAFAKPKKSTAIIDEIIQEFKDCKGIIVDVRWNGGGDDIIGKLIADRFADKKRLYMTTQIRNGPNHNDFTAPRYWYVEPDGPIQFTKPVILITHRFSISAAENFALAMRVLPHVTVVGDSTSGCFADVYRDKLPNGWDFSVSYKLFTDHEGFCWEGIGVPPDLRMINTKEDIEQGRDKVLEFAIKLLNTGALKPQIETSSLQNIRESLAKTLAQNIEEKGIDEAIKSFYKAKSKDPKTYYIDEEELNILGYQLLEEEKVQEAIEVFKLNTQEFPNSWNAYDSLGEAYLKVENKELAKLSYQKALELNPRWRPWEIEAYNKTKKLLGESN